MQRASRYTAVAVLALAPATAVADSPLGKALELMANLQAKIIKEGEESHRVFNEFTEWCEDRSKNVGYEIKTQKSEVAALEATISEAAAVVSELEAKIEQLTGDIAKDDADLEEAVGIRGEEAADFAAEEKEMKNIIGTLERAIGIVSKKMKGASMAQLNSARSVTDALSAMVQASVFSSADVERLTALVQHSQQANDSEEGVGAPDAAAYQNHSEGIVATLEDLLDKAQEQYDAAVKKETTSARNFDMLKESLESEIRNAKKELAAAQKGSAESSEQKAAAQGERDVTAKSLREDEATYTDLHAKCHDKAQDYEGEMKSRNEELQALQNAQDVLKEATGASLEQKSFLQISSAKLTSSVDLAHFEAVRFVRDLARTQRSSELALLAKRMASAMRVGASTGQNPFSKVKELIGDLIKKLESDAANDASHKGYCDKEYSETKGKLEDKTAEAAKLSTAISQMSARSAQLKEEVRGLQAALAEISASQSEMDRIRREEHDSFVATKATLDKGLDGTKAALKVLKDYYNVGEKGHEAATGAASGIIGILEVVETDFTKGITESVAAEESAVTSYNAESKENELTTTMKEQDVKYKEEEFHGLDKSVSETESDRAGVQAELDAISEYSTKLRGMCEEKAEPYEERERRRKAELVGLRQALDILEGEAVLLQRAAKKRVGLHGVSA